MCAAAGPRGQADRPRPAARLEPAECRVERVEPDQCRLAEPAHGRVQVLLRPEDLQWASSGATENATVEWRRFEGNCWLYGVALDDGTELRIRGTEDSQAVEPHSRVALEVNPQRVLKAFTMD